MVDIKLNLHAKWLSGEEGGERADLSDADLRGADLSDADLRGADLSDANLSDANLRRADLRRADLSDANLRRADLSDANLIDANLRRADLSDANLIGADLSDADLRGADLRGANLRGANLDFSSGLTLSCSSLGIKSNLRLVAQLAYHLARVECDAPEFKAVMKTKSFKALANSFHRVEECGKIG